MDISLFDYVLPRQYIAQRPAVPRDASRLLIVDRTHEVFVDSRMSQLPQLLRKGDVLVFNNSKVIPARLLGTKKTGGKAEVFLLHRETQSIWTALVGTRGSKKSIVVSFESGVEARILGRKKNIFHVAFNITGKALDVFIKRYGKTPTPPYIHHEAKEYEYQTVFADSKKSGSVAAPTAGLHFTHRLLDRLRKKGIQTEYVTLHVGLGTFAPVTVRDIRKHTMHPEFVELDVQTARRIMQAKQEGRRVIAVGTTTVRTLEGLLSKRRMLPQKTRREWINPFFYPGYSFKIVDGMITNFHLPKSTLLMLVSAFAGQERMLRAYAYAMQHHYRFYSFGDALLLVKIQGYTAPPCKYLAATSFGVK